MADKSRVEDGKMQAAAPRKSKPSPGPMHKAHISDPMLPLWASGSIQTVYMMIVPWFGWRMATECHGYMNNKHFQVSMIGLGLHGV